MPADSRPAACGLRPGSLTGSLGSGQGMRALDSSARAQHVCLPPDGSCDLCTDAPHRDVPLPFEAVCSPR